MTTEAEPCQFHNNCGGYCETQDEIENNLCENCLDAERELDAEVAATQALIKQQAAEIERLKATTLKDIDTMERMTAEIDRANALLRQALDACETAEAFLLSAGFQSTDCYAELSSVLDKAEREQT